MMLLVTGTGAAAVVVPTSKSYKKVRLDIQLGDSRHVVVPLHNIAVPFQNNEDRYTRIVQYLLKNVQ